MPRCTMPYIPLFREWFNRKFGDLCEKHDINYTYLSSRKTADCILASDIMARGYPMLAITVYIFVRIIGRRHYKKTR